MIDLICALPSSAHLAARSLFSAARRPDMPAGQPFASRTF